MVMRHDTARRKLNFMRHELRGALDNVHPEAIPTAAAATEQQSFAAGRVCSRCKYLPTTGSKLSFGVDCGPFCFISILFWSHYS